MGIIIDKFQAMDSTSAQLQTCIFPWPSLSGIESDRIQSAQRPPAKCIEVQTPGDCCGAMNTDQTAYPSGLASHEDVTG